MGHSLCSANLKRSAFGRGVRVEDKCRFVRGISLSVGNVAAHEGEFRFTSANCGVILLHLSQVARMEYRLLERAGAD